MVDERKFTRPNRRRFLRGSGVAAASVALAGCSAEEDLDSEPTETTSDGDSDETEDSTPADADEDADEIPRGGYFEFGMTSGATGLNWITAADMYTGLILNLVNETGTVVDPYTNEMRPWAFEDWTAEEVDDGLDVYFDVRDGLTWNDGTDFTVDDVLFSYQYFLEENPAEMASDIEPIQSVQEADNGWDLYMRLDDTLSVYDNTQLKLFLLPEHIWSDVDDYSEYQPTNYLDEGRPVGLGPGTVTRYEPDTTIEVTFRDPEEYVLGSVDWLQNHDHMRAGGPFLDGIRFNIYGSASALNEAVLQGEVDAMYDLPDPGYVDQMEDAENVEFVMGHDSGWNHYSFNLRNPPLDCTCFRQVLGFAFDDIYWVDQLNQGRAFKGDFPSPPAYITARPEYEEGEEHILNHPAREAFTFRENQPGVVDVDGIRDWLREGRVLDGTEGEYLGHEYPGSFTGVEASESEARYEYTFDEVESSVLEDAHADQEIRVDGQTIPELLGHPLRFLMSPPNDAPLGAQMIETYIGHLQSIGIPIEREVMTFTTRLNASMQDADFDIFSMGWTNQEPFGVRTLNSLFHSREAHEDPPGETLAPNAMGYGLDGLPGADEFIEQASTTMDTDERDEYVRMANERIYLDFPTIITSFEQPHWPVNAVDFEGYLHDLPDPGSSDNTTWIMQMLYPQE